MCFEILARVDSQEARNNVRHLSVISQADALKFAPVGTYPSTGIDVLIVGAGFGGLTAALEFTRKGHNVRVLERHSVPDVSGDMYFMGLSATRFLRHWPEMKRRYDDISLHNAWIETYKHDGALMLPPQKVSDRLHAAGLDPGNAPGAFQMRPLVHRMLLEQVEKLGIPIEYGSRVKAYFEDDQKGGVELDDGTRFKADLVVAADGIGSKANELMGGEVRARSSGRAMWRAVMPVECLNADPEVKKFFGLKDGTDPVVRTWFAPGSYALTLTRDDVVVWIINHDVTGSETESWNNTIEAEEVLDAMGNTPDGVPEWSPIFQRLVKCTPSGTIVNYELWWRDPQLQWASPSHRVVQIGDSAHSFLPSSGNGATQAFEDAVSLASCLQIGGKDKIQQAVKVHKTLRFTRTACAQKIGFSNAELLQKTDWAQVKLDPRKSSPRLPKWIWEHDAEVYAYENYKMCVGAMRKGVGLEDTKEIKPNYPKGYKFAPWSIDDIMQQVKKGKEIDLGPGEWY
ncbi:Uu.00g108080.m01.CDS01 [Anthostomella pinea]|uniref:Uu.00g108080.m01.CDS01 n=1 Tax=Anthostomella pinea TaxID=933095 RepID=A0AAI8VF52_9PEZI|nr:Uu.00g108080.m01.CDS01 [Anthostomella pinea]